MVTTKNKFKWGVIATILIVMLNVITFNYYRIKRAEAADHVGVCIRDRLLEAAELKSRAHDEIDAGREDAGDRLLRRAWQLEGNVVPCLEDFFDENRVPE